MRKVRRRPLASRLHLPLIREKLDMLIDWILIALVVVLVPLARHGVSALIPVREPRG